MTLPLLLTALRILWFESPVTLACDLWCCIAGLGNLLPPIPLLRVPLLTLHRQASPRSSSGSVEDLEKERRYLLQSSTPTPTPPPQEIGRDGKISCNCLCPILFTRRLYHICLLFAYIVYKPCSTYPTTFIHPYVYSYLLPVTVIYC